MKCYRLLLPILTIICLHSSAQSSDQIKQSKYQKLKRGIDAKQFHFIATSATTSRGKTIQLTGGYFLFLGGDSLTVDLPFFGTSYQSSGHYGASKEDAGVSFHTHEFTYSADTTKKGGWSITIQPKGQSSASKIYLSVSTSGSCRTSINSSNRSVMTYYGNVLSNFKD
jgi:hypothetical protein